MSKKVILCLENELFMKNNLLFTEKEDFIVRKISSQEFERGPVLMSYGALLHCTRGSAKVEINEHSYILEANTNINRSGSALFCLYPGFLSDRMSQS